MRNKEESGSRDRSQNSDLNHLVERNGVESSERLIWMEAPESNWFTLTGSHPNIPTP